MSLTIIATSIYFMQIASYLFCCKAPDWRGWHRDAARRTFLWSCYIRVAIHAYKMTIGTLMYVAQWQSPAHCALVYALHLLLGQFQHLGRGWHLGCVLALFSNLGHALKVMRKRKWRMGIGGKGRKGKKSFQI